jgi:hypothetical protein
MQSPKRRVLNKIQDLDNVHTCYSWGVRGSEVVKALCYKPEGRGFDSR